MLHLTQVHQMVGEERYGTVRVGFLGGNMAGPGTDFFAQHTHGGWGYRPSLSRGAVSATQTCISEAEEALDSTLLSPFPVYIAKPHTIIFAVVSRV